MSNDRYVSPLSERYASREMQYIFSQIGRASCRERV